MIVSAIDWLSISINLLLVLFVLICLVMSMIILMQRPKNEGLGAAFGSGATDQLFGARTTNVLQKGTVYLATLFFVLTLVLAVLISKRNADRPTLVAEAPAEAVVPAEATPAAGDEAPLEPEAVTPPIEVPAEPAEETPAAGETPAPEAPDEENSGPDAEETSDASESSAPLGAGAGAIIGNQSGDALEGAILGGAPGEEEAPAEEEGEEP